MEPAGSLPRSQEPATCPYPKPDQSCPRTINKINKTVQEWVSRSGHADQYLRQLQKYARETWIQHK
jgi:hypothetical protein